MLKIVDLDTCRKNYKGSVSINVHHLCASSEKSLACNGDSGGPLQSIVFLKGDARMVQHGIISFGSMFCNNGVPGVSTRIAFYMKWILDTITV